MSRVTATLSCLSVQAATPIPDDTPWDDRVTRGLVGGLEFFFPVEPGAFWGVWRLHLSLVDCPLLAARVTPSLAPPGSFSLFHRSLASGKS